MIDALWGGPIELFVIPASDPWQRLWYVSSCLWDDAYKRTLAANRNRVAHVAAAGFLSRYVSGPLPYVWRHITVDKMCWVHH